MSIRAVKKLQKQRLGKVSITSPGTADDVEKMELIELFGFMRKKWLTPFGWNCSGRTAKIVLETFAQLKEIEEK